MPLTLWTDKYEVGVESLDADHIIIFSLINYIDEAIRLDASQKTIHRMLRVLILLAVEHFQREEILMNKNAYPDTKAHTAEHHKIVKKLQSLIEAYEKSPTANVSGEIINVLAAWMNGHVMETDMRYRPFLTGQEASPRDAASEQPQAEPEQPVGSGP
ncbi:MAG: hemerythrin family protein [Rhodospirillales bacterium]|nr:hemerythrin family protein [Rhodospirillales bacterium]